MTIEEKETILKDLVGKTVGIHAPQVYTEFTLESYRVQKDGKMIIADLHGTGALITINAVLLFIKVDGKIVPVFGDSV